jgi:FlaA1/EpsC-like NDP-sugar epimerase
MELAETLISLSGLKPHQDIKIVETGMRPGEKLYEELTIETEGTVATSHPKIFISRIATLQSEEIQIALERLTQLVCDRDEDALRRFINELIPEARLTAAAPAEGTPEVEGEALVAGYATS